jgi:hypothetical protein
MASIPFLPVGTAIDPVGNSKLNRLGPQSTRPLPRWYWWSNAQNRWRRFDNVGTGTGRNSTLEQLSEQKKGGLKSGMHVKWPGNGGITIVKWDHANRKGIFAWNAGGNPTQIERKSQLEAAEIQANNFVYDHSGKDQPTDRMLKDNAHVVPMFRDMLNRELGYAKTHVFMYHSYHNVSLIYDLSACLMRVAFPDETTSNNRDALVLRTDRSTFNTRSPAAVQKNFGNWYNGTDVGRDNPPTRQFPWIGVSTVLNCFKTNPESTVVHDFKTGYNPGDSPNLNPVLDELLKLFNIAKLKNKLLQLTIEADVDVTSFLGDEAHFFFRDDPTKPWEVPPVADALETEFKDFMEHDNELGPLKKPAYGYWVELRRDGPGMQAYGTAWSPGWWPRKHEVITVTKNPGRYLQIGIPLELVDKLAYAAVPFGLPDTDTDHALDKMDTRNDLSDGGQARLIARPDLLWHPDVIQKVYQFSRGAASKRLEYLDSIQALLTNTLGPKGLTRIARKLRPPPIVVRSHNVKHNNKEMSKVVERLSSAATYDFACLQETTDEMLSELQDELPASHALLYAHACDAKKVYAAMAYRVDRFELLGDPFYGCFKLKSKTKQGGRPVVGAVFHDKWVGRRTLVLSIHAPHNSQEPYSLMPNLQYFVQKTIAAAKVQWAGVLEQGESDEFDSGEEDYNSGVAHVIIGGDFNRDDWQKARVLQAPYDLKLRSAQGLSKKPVYPTISGKAFDNILFSSRRFRYMLELNSFYAETDKRGSDHKAVVAQFLC